MKTTNTTIIILVITSLFVSCTKDIDNWYNSYDDIYGNNSNNTPGNMGGSTGNLSDNSFSDGTAYAESEEDQKGTFFSEGELLFSGKGHIKVNANAKAGIVSDDYIMIRPNTNIYVKATAGNGIKANDGIVSLSSYSGSSMGCGGFPGDGGWGF